MTLHAASDTLVGLLDSVLLQRVQEKEPKEQDQNDNHDRAADELSCGKLPGNQYPHQYTKFEHEICRSELKCHRGSEVSALANNRPRHGDRCIRAGG